MRLPILTYFDTNFNDEKRCHFTKCMDIEIPTLLTTPICDNRNV